MVTRKPNSIAAKKVAGAKKGFPARRPGIAARAVKRKPLPQYKSPTDFRPHFLLVTIATETDGLLSHRIKATRYQGRFDRDAEDKKKFDMAAYDAKTLIGIQARLAGRTFKATNDKKYPADPKARVDLKGAHRLPKGTTFQILMRVGKRSADSSLTCGVKQIWQIVENVKTGKRGPKELLKTDPVYRMIRGASRFLPAAFQEVQMPPKRTRRRADTDEE
jgi:hypothetical protein